MSLRSVLKHRFPAVHRLLIPLYWRFARPAARPVLEWQLANAYRRIDRTEEWADTASFVSGRISTRLASRDRYAGISTRAAEGYVHVGYSALRSIRLAMEEIGAEAPTTILDLPCGHGRILRVLTAAFPDAQITAAEIDVDMVRFCTNMFACLPMYSEDSPRSMELDQRFDLIWCGSLLTHLDEPLWQEFLQFFADHLSPDGLLLFSTHGQEARRRMVSGEFDYGLSADGLQRIIRARDEGGFGFVRYPGSSSYYGISLSSTSHVMTSIDRTHGLNLVKHIPSGLDDHQDVFACQQVDTER